MKILNNRAGGQDAEHNEHHHPEPLGAHGESGAEKQSLDFLRSNLEKKPGVKGPEYWRSLEELAQTDEFRAAVENEFPRYAPQEWEDDPSRRTFLKLSGASLALAGLTACTRQPGELIVPYVEQPEGLVPGVAEYFATASTLGGFAYGLIATSYMGRPIKVKGNVDHPASLGATDVFSQASTLDLYDPDRSQSLDRLGRIQPWETFVSEIQAPLRAQEALQGEGLRILTSTQTSPTFGALAGEVARRFPKAKWIQYESVNQDASGRAAEIAFGSRAVQTRYDLSKAEVVVALDSNFLTSGPGHLRYAKDFARKRSVRGGKRTMNRLYAVETSLTNTGAMADHRLPMRRAEVENFALALAGRLGVAVGGAPSVNDSAQSALLDALVADLNAHHGSSLVVAGEFTSPELQALAHAINAHLHNVGTTVLHTESVVVQPSDQGKALTELVSDMQAGKVDLLFVLDSNPVFEAPGDLDFIGAMQKVPQRVHLGVHKDETGEMCQWHIPMTHYLEAWGDARSFDGTVSVVQPLIEPIYDGKSCLEVLSVIAGTNQNGYDLVRGHWLAQGGTDTTWRQALHDGFVAGTAAPQVDVAVDGAAVAAAAGKLGSTAAIDGGVEVHFRPDPAIHDGRFANNGWLQELPKPLTLLTWDNAALMSAMTAQRLGVETSDVIKLSVGERRLDIPVLVQPGQADDALTINIGFGRKAAGRVGNDVGVDTNPFRTTGEPWYVDGVAVERTGLTNRLATTQSHFVIKNLEFELEDFKVEEEQVRERHLIKHTTLDAYKADPNFVEHQGHHVDESATLFPRWKYEGYSWGMAIDLTACTACNACVVACQAENNIPVVGKEQVINGREMHWIRIDRYYQGDISNPSVHHQPVGCMHCEQAPCEVVCPVAATVHGDEGLNQMVYNRCVGTRYCSNNCPYKVRRFNFFRYAHNYTASPLLRMVHNPEVTVRARGVMEKCSYCVQRINSARATAKLEDRQIADGEVVTACQEVCPSEAISFGNLNDETSQVNAWKAESTNYDLLKELLTLPRTTYLAKVTNPHPDLAPHDDHGGDHGAAESHGSEATATDDHATSDHG